MVPMLKCSKFIPTYYRAKDCLPKEGAYVNVAPNDAESAFKAVRYGRKWEIVDRKREDCRTFYTRIHSNDWWSYLEGGK